MSMQSERISELKITLQNFVQDRRAELHLAVHRKVTINDGSGYMYGLPTGTYAWIVIVGGTLAIPCQDAAHARRVINLYMNQHLQDVQALGSAWEEP